MTPPRTPKRSFVFTFDDPQALCEALGSRIRRCAEPEVCGPSTDLSEASHKVAYTQPVEAVVDFAVRHRNGMHWINGILNRDHPTRNLIWSMHHEAICTERIWRARAKRFMQWAVDARRPANSCSPVEVLADRALAASRKGGQNKKTMELAISGLSVKTRGTFHDRSRQPRDLGNGTKFAPFAACSSMAQQEAMMPKHTSHNLPAEPG